MSGVKASSVCNISSAVTSPALPMPSRSDSKYTMVTASFRILSPNIMACTSGDIGDSLKMLSVVTGSVELISAPNNMALFNENS